MVELNPNYRPYSFFRTDKLGCAARHGELHKAVTFVTPAHEQVYQVSKRDDEDLMSDHDNGGDVSPCDPHGKGNICEMAKYNSYQHGNEVFIGEEYPEILPFDPQTHSAKSIEDEKTKGWEWELQRNLYWKKPCNSGGKTNHPDDLAEEFGKPPQSILKKQNNCKCFLDNFKIFRQF